jgi:hypothetical protein
VELLECRQIKREAQSRLRSMRALRVVECASIQWEAARIFAMRTRAKLRCRRRRRRVRAARRDPSEASSATKCATSAMVREGVLVSCGARGVPITTDRDRSARSFGASAPEQGCVARGRRRASPSPRLRSEDRGAPPSPPAAASGPPAAPVDFLESARTLRVPT